MDKMRKRVGFTGLEHLGNPGFSGLLWKTAAMVFLAGLFLSGCGKEEVQEGPVTLTYATFSLDFEMEDWISQWNQSQEAYRIEILEYENSDTGRTKLNNEIISGKVPDLFDLSYLNVSSFISKGILADMNPFLDGDEKISREELLSGVLQTYETEEGLYGIMPEFRLELLAGKKSLVGEAVDFTVDKLLGMMEGLSEDEVLMDGFSPLGLIRAVLETDMGEFVDWERGTCFFDGEKFKKLLTTANHLETVYLEEKELEEGLAEGRVLFNRIYVTDLTEYVNSVKAFGEEEISLLGFPSETGGRAVLTARMPVGISQSCEFKEGAWEFVRSLLEEEFQTKHVRFCLPVRQDILKKGIEKVMTQNPYGDGPGSETWKPATQEEIDALYQGLGQMQYSGISDGEIWKIVSEEAELYFSGDKKVEEVMDVIQSRAALYVSENY